MADTTITDALRQAVSTVRNRIAKYRGDRAFNEQNTKASLIVPVLRALGWDTNDSEEVHWEYRAKPKHNPVDFALLLQRTPCMFLEAKALRESLNDDKLVVQILTYASVAGTHWIALSNGDEYRLYNAAAPVPADEKLFRTISISRDPADAVLATLSLLSKQNLQDKKIGRLWESDFVDRQVRGAMDDLFAPGDPARVVIRTIKRHLQGKLKDADIKASLGRMRLMVDFPEVPESAVEMGSEKSSMRSKKETPRASKRPSGRMDPSRVTLAMLISTGLITPPLEVFARYRGQRVTATINADGSVTHAERSYWSLSLAGGAARKPFFKGAPRTKAPATNGWSFWHLKTSPTGASAPIDVVRKRFLEIRSEESSRFLSPRGRGTIS